MTIPKKAEIIGMRSSLQRRARLKGSGLTAQRSAASRANAPLQVRFTAARGLAAATFCYAAFVERRSAPSL
jgi:hypothetical protein